MKANSLSVPMMYEIIKKKLPDEDFSLDVVARSNDTISFKLYIFRPVDEQTREINNELITADTFLELLNKIS